MKKPELISQNENYTALSVGGFEGISNYSLVHPGTGRELHKIFLKDIIGSTGMEVSFQTLQPGEELGYFHTHVKNEELYIIIRGRGKFQVDSNCFEIAEGSVVRVSPHGKRSMANTSANELIYMVIQAREGSLEEYSAEDGRLADNIKQW